MTSKFYLRNITSLHTPTTGEKSSVLPVDVLGANNATASKETRSLLAEKGVAQTSISNTSDATTSARDNYLARFTSLPVKAGTYGSGTWTMAMAMNESNNVSNSFLNFSLYFIVPGGTTPTGFIYNSHTNVGTEWANVETGEVNNITGVNVTANEGDVLVLEVWRHAVESGAAGAYAQIVYFEGATDPTDGTGTSDAAGYISAPADIPIIPFPTHNLGLNYAKLTPKWKRERKVEKKGRKTNPLFNAWHAIIVPLAFTLTEGGIQIIKTRKGLRKFFAKTRIPNIPFIPPPAAAVPVISYIWNFYAKYISNWLREEKREKIRVTPTPKYNAWVNLLNLFKKEIYNFRKIYHKRDPINKPNPKYTFWQNLITLLKNIQKPRPLVVKRKPINRPNPVFDAWSKFIAVVAAVPLISYTWNLYKTYIPVWNKKRRRERIRTPENPKYSLWFNLIKLLRRELPKARQWIVKRDPVDVENPQFNSTWLLRLLRQPIFKFRQLIEKREPVIRPTQKYELWINLLRLLSRNIKPILRVIVKRHPILRPNPRFSAWKAIFVVSVLPLISYPYSIYQKYLATWNKERKVQVRGHPTTPRFSTWSWNILNPEVISHLIGKAQQILRLKPFQWTKPNPHKRTRDTEPKE